MKKNHVHLSRNEFRNLKNADKISRKRFLQLLGATVAIPFIWLWNRSSGILSQGNQTKTIRIPTDFTNGVMFDEDFIITAPDNKLQVFSSRCTHLGCRIKNREGRLLVCPCHGSKFNTNGQPVEGPATKNLVSLKFKREKENLVVYF